MAEQLRQALAAQGCALTVIFHDAKPGTAVRNWQMLI